MFLDLYSPLILLTRMSVNAGYQKLNVLCQMVTSNQSWIRTAMIPFSRKLVTPIINLNEYDRVTQNQFLRCVNVMRIHLMLVHDVYDERLLVILLQ